MKNVLLGIVISLLVLMLLGCEEDKQESYKVLFVTDEATFEEVIVLDGQDIMMIEDPIMEHHQFMGWYLDEEWTSQFNSNSAINEDTTLYAKFVPKKYRVTIRDFEDNVILNIKKEYGYDLASLSDYIDNAIYTDASLQSDLVSGELTEDVVFYVEAVERNALYALINHEYYENNGMTNFENIELVADSHQYEFMYSAYDSSGTRDYVSFMPSIMYVNIYDDSTVNDLIFYAEQHNIPIITETVIDDVSLGDLYDVDYDGHYIFYSGFKSIAIDLAEIMVDDFKFNGTDKDNNDTLDILLVQGESEHPAMMYRTMGIERVLQENGVSYQITICESRSWNTDEINECISAARSQSEFDIVVSLADFITVAAIEEGLIYENDTVYSFDGIHEAMVYVSSGYIDYTISIAQELKYQLLFEVDTSFTTNTLSNLDELNINYFLYNGATFIELPIIIYSTE